MKVLEHRGPSLRPYTFDQNQTMKRLTQNQLTCWLNAGAVLLASFAISASAQDATNAAAAPEVRTPKAPAPPRINGPGIFGVRPGHTFLYHIPATGDRPMTFA